MSKLRIFATAVILTVSIVCMVFADTKMTPKDIATAREVCGRVAKEYRDNCIKNSPPGNPDADIARCNQEAEGVDIQCLRDSGVLDARDTAQGIGQVSPPPKSNPNKPRKGPGQTVPPNKSNPTPTPRKGPEKTGTSGVGHASPSPSSTLLNKHPTPTPTPTSTPKKKHS